MALLGVLTCTSQLVHFEDRHKVVKTGRKDSEYFKMSIKIVNMKFEETMARSGFIPEGWKARHYLPSHRTLNKFQKIKNGNRMEQLKVIHWNGGSKIVEEQTY